MIKQMRLEQGNTQGTYSRWEREREKNARKKCVEEGEKTEREESNGEDIHRRRERN